MATNFIKSKENVSIAYDITGEGPALVLLHGGGKTRNHWHKEGYVERFLKNFTVIAIDIRGSGESDFLIEESDYDIEKICDDIFAVVDNCHIDTFAVCGYSFGGAIGKYLAARNRRVTALAMIGVSLFGPTVSKKFEANIEEFVKKWTPTLKKYKSGEFTHNDPKTAVKRRVVIWVPCFSAMKKWPALEPKDIKCPVLLLSGSKNTAQMNWIKNNKNILDKANVNVLVIEGLDHRQEFNKIDNVFPVLSNFFRKHAK